MTGFADHFSTQARTYASARPTYPPDLFAWLADLAPRTGTAWDCGTGNGQAALGLARHFGAVIATDPSVAQLAHAARDSRVHYAAGTAEDAPIRGGSIDVITVAQALHWFDVDRFYADVRRVACEHAVLVAWSYGMTRVDGDAQALLDDFYGGTLGAYWPPERVLVEEGYRSLPFPFERLDAPAFVMQREWERDELVNYVATWSAVAAARRATGSDPVPAFAAALRDGWPDAERRAITWPIAVLAGRVAG